MVKKPKESPKPGLEKSTLQSTALMERNFTCYIPMICFLFGPNCIDRFIQYLEPVDPRHWLEHVDLNVVKAFLQWHLETHNVISLSSFLIRNQYCPQKINLSGVLSSQNSETAEMRALSKISFSHEACVAAVHDYYRFLVQLYLDESTIIEPPEDGWPDLERYNKRDCLQDMKAALKKHYPHHAESW